jgi:RNA polymerase sigma factor (sigma-70 family)
MLRAQLAERFPGRPEDEIEEAVQTACHRFLDKGPDISDPGRAYAWLRTVAHHALIDELRVRRRAVAADPTDPVIEAVEAEHPGPVEELIELEQGSELGLLVEEVSSTLSDRRREVFALWAAGRRRPEIAEELGISDRAVKKALEQIMQSAREVVARRAGGGCAEGESLVLRLTCGLAEAGEAARARLHISHCARCSTFAEELEGWREKAGALLPAPLVAEVASPGVVGRAVGRVEHAIGSARRHLVGGSAQVRQQASLAGYTRTDPTPLAGIRPGAAAAVVVGCLAIGGGAGYCVHKGVDPLGPAKNLIAGTSEEPKQEPAPSGSEVPEAPAEEPVEEAPAVVPSYETAVEQPPAEESSSRPESEKAAVEPAAPVEEASPPPAEQSFEPASPDYPATESSVSSSGSESSAPAETSHAKAVPAGEAPQFGGP